MDHFYRCLPGAIDVVNRLHTTKSIRVAVFCQWTGRLHVAKAISEAVFREVPPALLFYQMHRNARHDELVGSICRCAAWKRVHHRIHFHTNVRLVEFCNVEFSKCHNLCSRWCLIADLYRCHRSPTNLPRKGSHQSVLHWTGIQWFKMGFFQGVFCAWHRAGRGSDLGSHRQ